MKVGSKPTSVVPIEIILKKDLESRGYWRQAQGKVPGDSKWFYTDLREALRVPLGVQVHSVSACVHNQLRQDFRR